MIQDIAPMQLDNSYKRKYRMQAAGCLVLESERYIWNIMENCSF